MIRLALLAAPFILFGVAAAHAQGAPPPPPGPGAEAPPPPMEGRGGFMYMHHHPMMRDSAGFRFRRDGAEIDIRCAANEPTKACVDAASVLIDKVMTATAAH